MKAIYNAYCNTTGRTQTLPIGLLKNSLGHTEGASGIVSMIKVLIVYENECIPKNINLKQLSEQFKVYCPPILPVTDSYLYKPGK
jgi:acyl transferase domain-containing protein